MDWDNEIGHILGRVDINKILCGLARHVAGVNGHCEELTQLSLLPHIKVNHRDLNTEEDLLQEFFSFFPAT